ncbi:MAG TPA: hypothetical protein VM818_10525 [Vicinamibacterales bacterium]|nr:hypothetical protein [Vicinamibacterales bacterium]
MTNVSPDHDDRRHTIEAREKIAVAAGFALLVAGAVLLTVVLPAEYGLDPFGTGERLGLMALAEATEAAVAPTVISSGPAKTVNPQQGVYKVDSREFQLQPKEGMEFKYHIERGGGLLYTWIASGAVDFEFHGEPDGAKPGTYESYELSAGDRGAGTFTAPFTGIHGWYWENKGASPVTVSLTSAGFYTRATEFRTNKRVFQHQLPDVQTANVTPGGR